MPLTHELVFNVTKDIRKVDGYTNYSGIRDEILDVIENKFRAMNKARYSEYNGKERNYTNSRRSDNVVESVASQLPDIVTFPCQVKITVTFDMSPHGKVINSSVLVTSDSITI